MRFRPKTSYLPGCQFDWRSSRQKKIKKKAHPAFFFCSVPIILDKIYHRKEAKMFSFRTLWRAFLTLMGVPWQDLSPPKKEKEKK